MVAYAKANPGKLTVATNGEGGFPHLAFEHLRTMAGFTYTHVPYKGSAAIATDIIGGQVQVGIDGITGMTPHIKSGRLRLLAITNKTRAALWPDTPAAAEDVPGYESGGWFGYVAPAATPRDIVAQAERRDQPRDAAARRERQAGGRGPHRRHRVARVFRRRL